MDGLARLVGCPYQIPIKYRYTHCYCIGTTGQGKSKFLENLIVSDIRAGRGCGLVDPHTDLARDTLAHLLSVGYFNHETAHQRVIYFDPTRSDYTIPFNVLKSPVPPYTLAQQIIEAFRRTWPQSLDEAPRFTNIALASLLVLIETGRSLIDMAELLTGKAFREKLLSQVHHPQLVEFFHTRFDQWGREGPMMIELTLNKVSAFAFNPHLKHLLGASTNRLDFRAIMDNRQVLIVDLGNCDGETRRLVGSLVVTGMEQAALARKDQTSGRHPFYLFLDEFQDFCAGDGAAKTLAQILSECRKFGLHLHLAHQTLGQVQHRVSSALGNVGIKVVFSVDREDAEVMAKKLFECRHRRSQARCPNGYPASPVLKHCGAMGAGHRRHSKLATATALVKRRGQRVVRMQTQQVRPYQVGAQAVSELMRDLAKIHGEPISTALEAEQPVNPQLPKRQIEDWEPRPTTHSATAQGASQVIFVSEHD